MTLNLALLKERPASRPALGMLLSICLAIAGCGGIETRPGGDADSSSAEGSVPADRSPLGQAVDTAFVCQNFEYSRADFLTSLRSALRTTSGEICEQSFLRQLESLLEDDFRRFQASLARFKSDVATAIGRIGDEQKSYLSNVCGPLTSSVARLDADIGEKKAALKSARGQIEKIRSHLQNQLSDLSTALDRCEDDRKQCALGMYRVFMGSLLAPGHGAGSQLIDIGAEQIKSLQSLGAQGRRVRQDLQKCVAAIKSYDPEPAATLLAASRPVFQPLSKIDWPDRENLVPLLAGLVTEHFSDQILAIIERFLRGADAQIEKIDEKLFGAVTLLNAFAEDRIQKTVNNLFNKVDEFTRGDASTPSADEKTTLREHFDISLAAASCRRLFTPPNPGEGRYLMPYVYRAFIANAAREGTRERVRGYKREMERVTSLFSCEDAEEVKLERRYTTEVLARKAELYRYLENVCNAFNIVARDGGRCLALATSFSASLSADLNDVFAAAAADNTARTLDLVNPAKDALSLRASLAAFAGLLTQSRFASDVAVTLYRYTGTDETAARNLLVRRTGKADGCHSYGKLGDLAGSYCASQKDTAATPGTGRYSLTATSGALPKDYLDYFAGVGEWLAAISHGSVRLAEVHVVETRVTDAVAAAPSLKLVFQFTPRPESGHADAAR